MEENDNDKINIKKYKKAKKCDPNTNSDIATMPSGAFALSSNNEQIPDFNEDFQNDEIPILVQSIPEEKKLIKNQPVKAQLLHEENLPNEKEFDIIVNPLHEYEKNDAEAKMPQYSEIFPFSKTSILEPYLFSSLEIIKIYPKKDKALPGKEVYKISLNSGENLILKCENFDFDREQKKMDTLNREFYIGKTFSGFSENVVKTFDVQQYKDFENKKIRVEILMEYGGPSLEAQKLNTQEILLIISQFIRVCEIMEKVGIAHFDLKPANMVFDPHTQILKIIDFGTSISFYETPEIIRKNIGDYYSRVTGFTEVFAPPEVFVSGKVADIIKSVIPMKFDVFCFGTTCLYLILSQHDLKKKLFDRDISEKEHSEFIQRMQEILMMLDEKYLMPLLKRCLEYKPENRPSFTEIKTEFMNIVKNHYDMKDVSKEKKNKINHLDLINMYIDLRRTELAARHFELYISEKDEDFDINNAIKAADGLFEKYFGQGNEEKTTEMFDKLIDCTIKIYNIPDSELIKAYKIFAIRCSNLGLITKMKSYFKQALKLIKKNPNTKYDDLYEEYKNLGERFSASNSPENSIKYYLKACNMLIKMGKEISEETSKLYELIAEQYLASELPKEKYFEYYISSILIKQKIDEETKFSLIDQFKNIALSFRSYNLLEESVDVYEKYLSENKPKFKEGFLPDLKEYKKIVDKLNNEEEDSEENDNFDEEIAKLIKEYGENSLEVYEKYKNKGFQISIHSQYERALEYFNKCLKIIQEGHPKNYLELMHSYRVIAEQYIAMKENDIAQEYFNKILDVAIKIPKDLYGEFKEIVKCLATKYEISKELNKYQEYIYLKGLEFLKGKIELENYVSLYRNIENFYFEIGQKDIAMKYFYTEIELYKANYGEYSKELIDYYESSAIYFDGYEMEDLALEYRQKAVQIAEKLYGINSENTINSYRNLIWQYQTMNKTLEVIEYRLKIIEFCKKNRGESNEDMLSSLLNLSHDYLKANLKEKAVLAFEKHINIAEKLYKNDDEKLMKFYEDAGNNYEKLELYEKAIEFYLKQLEMYKKTYGEDYSAIRLIYKNISEIYTKMKNPEKSAEYMKKYENVKNILKSQGVSYFEEDDKD